MAAPQFNTRNAGVKRLMKEAMELKEPTDMYAAQPFSDNLFEWHFTVRGPADSDFEGGIYHGRIIFPSDYPMKPPNLVVLTPNGRFELNKKICLSISGYHPETWLPSWSIRTALIALIGFMPSEPGGAIGSLKYPTEERKKLAKLSLNWTCKECGLCMKDALKSVSSENKELAEAVSTSIVDGEAPENVSNTVETQPDEIATHESTTNPVEQASPSSNLTISSPRPTTSIQSNGISFFALSALIVVLVSIFVMLVLRRIIT